MADSALAKFIRASDVVIAFNANFNDIKDELQSVSILRIYRDEVQKMWDKVKESYEDCIIFMNSTKSTPEDIDAANAKYTATFNDFASCIGAIEDKINLLTPKIKLTDTPVVSSDPGHNLTLPPCDVDTFEGGYLEWPKFRELFTALYIKSARLSNVERLCHLLRKTSGEAKEIVSKFPLSDIGFELAWGSLKSAYENPRMLVNNQLKSLFSLPTVAKETAAGLKGLQRGVNSCLSALSVYNVPTKDWDPILIFICIQRLPTVTINFWEQSVKDKSVLSKWKDFDAFLTERIHTLECVSDLASASSSSSSSSNKRTTEQRVKAHVVNSSVASKECIACRGQGHYLRQCRRFKGLSVADRFSLIKRYHCCVNCFSTEHEVKNCNSSFNCSVCKKRHHTMLHRDIPSAAGEGNSNSVPSPPRIRNSSSVSSPSRNTTSTQTNTTAANTQIQSTTSRDFSSGATRNQQVFHVSQNSKVLLGTAMVNIVHQGMTYPARALIDPAAESSFIAESLQNRLRLTTHSTNVRVSGINQSTSAQSRKLCPLRISSPLNHSLVLETVALVLPNISGNLPSFNIGSEVRSRFCNLTLADPHFYSCRPVDLLLGADLYPQIMTGEIHRDVLGSLIGQRTVFGWIITGPIREQRIQVYSTTIECSPEDTLNKNMLRFWELEEPPKRKILSPSDKFCEENYRLTTRRDAEGRYVVTLPFKPDFPTAINLGSSKQNVLAQYNRIESYLSRKPEVKELYHKVLREYLDLHHMKPISHNISRSAVSCYLPHHPVIKPDSKTTKWRVVFNASNKTSNGVSLNDCLFVGPTLQSDLVLLILRWRLYRYVFNCDITQMYRQIRLDPAHTPYQRIFFRDSPTEAVEEFELQTVTFGVNCDPFLAIRTLLQLANDSKTGYPIAAYILRKCMYVNDVLTGAHDVSSALQARDELSTVLSSAKFELRKWASNYVRILYEYKSLLSGALAKSPSLSYSEKHPIILPYSCRLSRLLVDFAHKSTIHGGNQLMLRTIRNEYWIPRLKNLVRATYNGCKRCILYRKRSCNQIMAALPSERTTLGRPFTNTGVDFAGPFDLRNFTARSCKITKAYVCIFVCFATKAVHLEATSDLSTDAFLAAFHRFIARRGCPATMFSDNGTNFVGASREIENEFKTFLKECQARLVSTFNVQGLSWRFIPAGAPHMGGLWEAAVKSFKSHFRKESHSVKYTFEELSTILARIEACLNSRPLCPMSENPGEDLALTPGHFLIGSPILTPPEPSIYESPIGMVNRYRKMKAFTHEFCRRWKEEYLANLHKRYKWKFPERDLSVNDIVVIRNEQLMPTAWKLGVVEKIYPGTDGHVRVADVKTENGMVKRPITKLVVLSNE